jgi:uncharacterized membrane protein YjgN (DUF898 family)
VALVAGVNAREMEPLWLFALLGASAFAIERGVRFRRFAFVLYGVVYAYVGVTSEVFHSFLEFTAILTYLVLSAAVVVGSLVFVSRRFGRVA